jgi:uncharacterized cupin superfamily protein
VARVNVFDGRFEYDDGDPPGYRNGMLRASADGGELAVKAFVLPAGESLCPYHYEYVEEWLLVLEGEVTVRTPAGEQPAARGELIRFPAGRDGAHKVSNPGASEARVVMFSSAREPSVAVYPDSDKIGVWVPGDADDVMLRRPDGKVDYWEGEA